MALNARQKSSELYDLLDQVGVSENLRLLARNSTIIFEIMNTLSIETEFGIKSNRIVSGSRYEGSCIPGMMSDLDIVMLEGIVFLEASKMHSSLIVVQDEYVHPGYVKLQLSLNGQPQTIFSNPSFKPDECYEFDCIGRICHKGFHHESMNGPAVPIFDDTLKHSMDMVFGKFSDNIPHSAQEWLGRKRRYGWPSDQQVKEMMGMGCVYVYVGHEWSAEAVVMWRLSFTRQERLLMASLNPVQHKVYILLKVIKKHVIQPRCNAEVLTSYHCKTCILYMAETTPQNVWIIENLVDCLIACLKTLYRWVTNRFCPSFFMKDQNLFAKSVFRRNIHLMAQALKELIELDDRIVELLYKDYIDAMLIHMDNLVGNEIMLANIILMPLFSLKVDCFSVTDRYLNDIVLHRLVNHLKRTECVAFHTAEETHLAVSYYKSFSYFYLGRFLLSELITKPTVSNEKYHIGNAYYYLSLATQTGQVSVRLFLASFLFKMKKYKKCSAILSSVESDLEQSVYDCVCNSKTFATMPNDLASFYSRQPIEIYLGKVERCIEVFPHEKELIPLAFQLEMFRVNGVNPGLTDNSYMVWFKNAVVDPYSFLLFMQYLVGLALNRCDQMKNALRKLSKLTKDVRAFHRETTYNLLGWVYIQENQLGTAMQCFMESWKIRPNYNAAKFHVNSLSNTFNRLVCEWQKP